MPKVNLQRLPVCTHMYLQTHGSTHIQIISYSVLAILCIFIASLYTWQLDEWVLGVHMVYHPAFSLYADLFNIKNDKAVACKVHHWVHPSPTWPPVAFSISGAGKKKLCEAVSDRFNLKRSTRDRLACQTVNQSGIEM